MTGSISNKALGRGFNTITYLSFRVDIFASSLYLISKGGFCPHTLYVLDKK